MIESQGDFRKGRTAKTFNSTNSLELNKDLDQIRSDQIQIKSDCLYIRSMPIFIKGRPFNGSSFRFMFS